MLYLIWGLINLALFVGFIGLCLGATKMVRKRFGIFACILFVFGMLSFAGGTNDDDSGDHGTDKIKTWNFTSADSASYYVKGVQNTTLEETFTLKYMLGIKYGQHNKTMSAVPMSASSSTTGLVMGTSWQPLSINLHSTANSKQLRYVVTGIVKWKLLGATIYAQLKEFNGLAEMNKKQ